MILINVFILIIVGSYIVSRISTLQDWWPCLDAGDPDRLLRTWFKRGTVGQIWSLTNDGYLAQNPNAVLNVISESDPQVHLETKYASDNQNVWTLNEHGNLVYNKATGSKLNGYVLGTDTSNGSLVHLIPDNNSSGLSPLYRQWDFVPF